MYHLYIRKVSAVSIENILMSHSYDVIYESDNFA